MGYFDSEENVDAYIAMADGYDGADLIALLRRYLPEGSSVLELGMGPGKDLDLLRQAYRVTGSDTSRVFLDRYKKDHPDADLLLLDAIRMDTDRTFDCIYSNKVLHHLSRVELETSLRRQKAVLNDAGMLLHSFWYGTGDEEHHGLRFTSYTEPDLRATVCDGFDIVAVEQYKEINDGDSLYMLLRKTMTDKKQKRLSRRFTDSWPRFVLQFTAILVGVLVAFSLNSWRERSADRELERFYIQEIVSNLAADEAQLRQIIEVQQRKQTALDTLLQIMPEAAPEDKPAIDALFATTRRNPTFFPTVGAYRAMVSEGALNLISNKSLVTLLVELYEHYYVRLSYFGTVLDDETERITWERRKYYSLYTDEFYGLEAIRSREMYSLNEHGHAYIGWYLGIARSTYDKIAEVRAALEQELRRIE